MACGNLWRNGRLVGGEHCLNGKFLKSTARLKPGEVCTFTDCRGPRGIIIDEFTGRSGKYHNYKTVPNPNQEVVPSSEKVYAT